MMYSLEHSWRAKAGMKDAAESKSLEISACWRGEPRLLTVRWLRDRLRGSVGLSCGGLALHKKCLKTYEIARLRFNSKSQNINKTSYLKYAL